MKNLNLPENTTNEVIELLNDFIEWWDVWNASKNPTEVGDPPIEYARKLLQEKNLYREYGVRKDNSNF